MFEANRLLTDLEVDEESELEHDGIKCLISREIVE
jgi:hypothetical protein